MRVTLVNTASDGGGAALAAKRLMYALEKKDIDVRLLVRDGHKPHALITILADRPLKRFLGTLRFAFEKLFFLFHEKNKSVRFAFSLARTGQSISKHHSLEHADIIHLHWITNSFISLNELNNILKIDKPIVWTLHDMWAFTGGCHYASTCTRFMEECSYCPFLRNPNKNDLSAKIFKKKEKIYSDKKITVVTCSNWLREQAVESTLFSKFNIVNIPNPINTEKYRPVDRKDARNRLMLPLDKHLVLFGAANIEDSRKGLMHLVEGLKYLYENKPFTTNDMELVVFGKSHHDLKNLLPYDVISMNYIDDQNTLIELYAAVDVFVLPSLEDNLPNTIMESMACGTPVVAYNTGGIPEMIDHQVNGYLAEYKSSVDLAEGIFWVIYQSELEQLRESARKKVIENYQESIISQKYIDLYQSLLNSQKS